MRDLINKYQPSKCAPLVAPRELHWFTFIKGGDDGDIRVLGSIDLNSMIC